MKCLRVALALVVFIPGSALLEALSTFDGGFPVWQGWRSAGGFFGLVFGGALAVRAGVVTERTAIG